MQGLGSVFVTEFCCVGPCGDLSHQGVWLQKLFLNGFQPNKVPPPPNEGWFGGLLASSILKFEATEWEMQLGALKPPANTRTHPLSCAAPPACTPPTPTPLSHLCHTPHTSLTHPSLTPLTTAQEVSCLLAATHQHCMSDLTQKAACLTPLPPPKVSDHWHHVIEV